MYRPASSDDLRFFNQTGTTDLMTLTSTNSVGISTTTPNSSAALDITSTTKGFLLPRMTTAQRTAIATPATGLQVYDTTTNTVWYHNGTAWTNTAAASVSLNSAQILVGNASNVATAVTMSGDATLSNAGALTIGTGAVTSAKILDATVANADLATGAGGIYKGSGSLSGATTVAQAANTLAFTGTATNAFSVDGTTLSVDAANNRVGIGTAAPIHNLSVDSASNTRIGINAPENFQTGVAFSSAGTDKWIMYRPANSDDLRFFNQTGTTDLMSLTSTNSVGINTTTPNSSAALDITSTSKGFLMPRMTTAQRTAITTPATGLQVYDTTTNTVWYHNGTAWTNTAAATASLSSAQILVGNASNVATAVTMSGDATLSNAGALTIGTGAVTSAKILDATVANADLATGTGGIYKGSGSLSGATTVAQAANTLAFTGTATNAFSVDGTTLSVDAANNRVGIGTAAPIHNLSVDSADNTRIGVNAPANFQSGVTLSSGGTDRWVMYRPANSDDLRFFNTTTNVDQLTFAAAGNTGLGILTPNASAALDITSTTRGFLMPRMTTAQRTAIATPATGLQVYDTTTNTIWYHNGTAWTNSTAASGIYGGSGSLSGATTVTQAANTLAFIGTATNAFSVDGTTFSVDAANNMVGIGTSSPQAPLHVTGTTSNSFTHGTHSYLHSAGVISNSPGSGGRTDASIVAAGNIWSGASMISAQSITFSDKRIKDVIGVSDSHNDLDVLNKIMITDYTMKDKSVYGDEQFKKVIAQQVEEVYPLAVSKKFNYVPNIYQIAENVTSLGSNTYKMTFKNKPSYDANVTGNVKIYDEKNEIIAKVVSKGDHEIVFTSETAITGKVFLYGEEVNDFRAVDYEALATLNISATQELYKQIQDLKAQNAKLTASAEEAQKLKAEFAELAVQVKEMKEAMGMTASK